MWTRKQLKDKAKASFRLNYWKAVLVGLLALALVGGVGSAAGGFRDHWDSPGTSRASTFIVGDDTAGEGIGSTFVVVREGERYEITAGPDTTFEEVLEGLDMATGTTFAEHGLHDMFPGLAIFGLIVGAFGLLVVANAVVLSVFIVNPLSMGASRFFLQNLNRPAEVKEVAYGFDHNYRETVKTLFMRDIFILLWSLLFIVPGIVKAYEYRMIPYLLADDPTMTKDRAFAESRRMMHGNKWNAFVLDLSFLGWSLLSILTLGLLAIFYVGPYKYATDAALYEELRYGAAAPGLAEGSPATSGGQVPVPPFAAQDGFATGEPEA